MSNSAIAKHIENDAQFVAGGYFNDYLPTRAKDKSDVIWALSRKLDGQEACLVKDNTILNNLCEKAGYHNLKYADDAALTAEFVQKVADNHTRDLSKIIDSQFITEDHVMKLPRATSGDPYNRFSYSDVPEKFRNDKVKIEMLQYSPHELKNMTDNFGSDLVAYVEKNLNAKYQDFNGWNINDFAENPKFLEALVEKGHPELISNASPRQLNEDIARAWARAIKDEPARTIDSKALNNIFDAGFAKAAVEENPVIFATKYYNNGASFLVDEARRNGTLAEITLAADVARQKLSTDDYLYCNLLSGETLHGFPKERLEDKSIAQLALKSNPKFAEDLSNDFVSKNLEFIFEQLGEKEFKGQASGFYERALANKNTKLVKELSDKIGIEHQWISKINENILNDNFDTFFEATKNNVELQNKIVNNYQFNKVAKTKISENILTRDNLEFAYNREVFSTVSPKVIEDNSDIIIKNINKNGGNFYELVYLTREMKNAEKIINAMPAETISDAVLSHYKFSDEIIIKYGDMICENNKADARILNNLYKRLSHVGASAEKTEPIRQKIINNISDDVARDLVSNGHYDQSLLSHYLKRDANAERLLNNGIEKKYINSIICSDPKNANLIFGRDFEKAFNFTKNDVYVQNEAINHLGAFSKASDDNIEKLCKNILETDLRFYPKETLRKASPELIEKNFDRILIWANGGESLNDFTKVLDKKDIGISQHHLAKIFASSNENYYASAINGLKDESLVNHFDLILQNAKRNDNAAIALYEQLNKGAKLEPQMAKQMDLMVKEVSLEKMGSYVQHLSPDAKGSLANHFLADNDFRKACNITTARDEQNIIKLFKEGFTHDLIENPKTIAALGTDRALLFARHTPNLAFNNSIEPSFHKNIDDFLKVNDFLTKQVYDNTKVFDAPIMEQTMKMLKSDEKAFKQLAETIDKGFSKENARAIANLYMQVNNIGTGNFDNSIEYLRANPYSSDAVIGTMFGKDAHDMESFFKMYTDEDRLGRLKTALAKDKDSQKAIANIERFIDDYQFIKNSDEATIRAISENIVAKSNDAEFVGRFAKNYIENNQLESTIRTMYEKEINQSLTKLNSFGQKATDNLGKYTEVIDGINVHHLNGANFKMLIHSQNSVDGLFNPKINYATNQCLSYIGEGNIARLDYGYHVAYTDIKPNSLMSLSNTDQGSNTNHNAWHTAKNVDNTYFDTSDNIINKTIHHHNEVNIRFQTQHNEINKPSAIVAFGEKPREDILKLAKQHDVPVICINQEKYMKQMEVKITKLGKDIMAAPNKASANQVMDYVYGMSSYLSSSQVMNKDLDFVKGTEFLSSAKFIENTESVIQEVMKHADQNTINELNREFKRVSLGRGYNNSNPIYPELGKTQELLDAMSDKTPFKKTKPNLSLLDEKLHAVEVPFKFSDKLDFLGIDDLQGRITQNAPIIDSRQKAVLSSIERATDDFVAKTGYKGIDKNNFLVDIGSTSRRTAIPGIEPDFDYMYYIGGSLDNINDVRAPIAKEFGFEGKLPKRNNLRYSVKDGGIDFRTHLSTPLEGNIRVPVDISFLGYKNDNQLYSDVALKKVLDNIQATDEVKYNKVIANIVKAKEDLSTAGVYKKFDGGIGGVGVETWVLRNGGSYEEASKSFMEVANKSASLEEFKQNYAIADFGINRQKNTADNFVENLTPESFEKMKSTLSKETKRTIEQVAIKGTSKTVNALGKTANAANFVYNDMSVYGLANKAVIAGGKKALSTKPGKVVAEATTKTTKKAVEKVAATTVGKAVAKGGAKIGAKVGVKAIPIVGWAITAADVGYQVHHTNKEYKELKDEFLKWPQDKQNAFIKENPVDAGNIIDKFTKDDKEFFANKNPKASKDFANRSFWDKTKEVSQYAGDSVKKGMGLDLIGDGKQALGGEVGAFTSTPSDRLNSFSKQYEQKIIDDKKELNESKTSLRDAKKTNNETPQVPAKQNVKSTIDWQSAIQYR